MIRIAAATTLALALTVPASYAGASSKRSPLFERPSHETELSLDRWETTAVVERTRTAGHKYAVFHADPQDIAPGAVLVFQAESEGQVRWRCVAVDDVAECLGKPVRVAYRQKDETVRLTVKAVPENSAHGKALVREARESRADALVARG